MQPPACRTDRQGCHQTVAWLTPTLPPLSPPHPSPQLPSPSQATSQHPRDSSTEVLRNCPAHCDWAPRPGDVTRVALCPKGCPEKSSEGWHPCASPCQHRVWQQARRPASPTARELFWSSTGGQGGRFPSGVCSGSQRNGCSQGKNRPSPPAAAPRVSHPPLQKPLVEETETSLLLIPALATAKPQGTAVGSIPTREGAGNTALSEGCSNKQEPVKSCPSQTLISV